MSSECRDKKADREHMILSHDESTTRPLEFLRECCKSFAHLPPTCAESGEAQSLSQRLFDLDRILTNISSSSIVSRPNLQDSILAFAVSIKDYERQLSHQEPEDGGPEVAKTQEPKDERTRETKTFSTNESNGRYFTCMKRLLALVLSLISISEPATSLPTDLAESSAVEIREAARKTRVFLKKRHQNETSSAVMLLLDEILLDLPVRDDIVTSHPEALWIVPYAPVKGFKAESALMGEMEKAIGLDGSSRKLQIVLHGSAGSGKTALAVELAYRVRKELNGCSVIWLDAHTMSSLEAAYCKLLNTAHVQGRANPALDRMHLGRQWLSEEAPTPWLVIIDSFGDEYPTQLTSTGKSIFDYIPQRAGCCVLFVNRSRDLMEQLVPKADAFFSLSEESLGRQSALPREGHPASRPLAHAITRNKMALAKSNNHSSEDTTAQALRIADTIKGERFPQSRHIIAATIMILQYLKLKDQITFEDVCKASFFHSFDIPFSLLNSIKIHDLERYEVGNTPLDYNLVLSSEDRKAFHMSSLIQWVVRQWMQSYEPEIHKGIVTSILGRWSQLFQFTPQNASLQVVPHAEALIRQCKDSTLESNYYRANLFKFLFDRNFATMHFLEAESSARQAYEIYRVTLESNAAPTIFSMNAYGLASLYLGRRNEARALLRQALHASEQSLGSGHFATWTIQRNLDCLKKSPRQLEEEAEDIYLIRSRVLGDEIAEICTAPAATAYQWFQAERDRGENPDQMIATFLSTIESRNGSFHHLTAAINHYVGRYRLVTSDYDAAKKHFRRAVDIHTCSFGPSDLMTLTDAHFLALSLFEARQYEESEALFRHVYRRRADLLTHRSSQTLQTLIKITDVLQKQERLEEGKPLLQSALDDLIETAGRTHIRTLQVAEQLYICHILTADMLAADDICHEYAPLADETFGADTPETFLWITRLSWALMRAGRLDEAAPFLHRSLRRQFLDEQSQADETINVYMRILNVLHEQKLYASVCAVGARVLALSEKWYGPSHNFTTNALRGLYDAFRMAEKVPEAKEIESILAKRIGESSDFLEKERMKAVDEFEQIVQRAGGEIVDRDAPVLVIRSKEGQSSQAPCDTVEEK